MLNSGTFIGASQAFVSIVEMIEAVVSRRCGVIITGETGTGKGMVARHLCL
jgi:transcriptional regulator with GAF, ATPase, and Fis domain